MAMPKLPLTLTRKTLLYASKTLLGAIISWYALRAFGIVDPVWGIITIILVSDPDMSTAANLSKVRIINTVVGCIIGLISLFLFGYAPSSMILTVVATILLVMSYEKYPSNWRLAPVTVVILMDAARLATSSAEELELAFMRAGEIAFGCAVALVLSFLYAPLNQNKGRVG